MSWLLSPPLRECQSVWLWWVSCFAWRLGARWTDPSPKVRKRASMPSHPNRKHCSSGLLDANSRGAKPGISTHVTAACWSLLHTCLLPHGALSSALILLLLQALSWAPASLVLQPCWILLSYVLHCPFPHSSIVKMSFVVVLLWLNVTQWLCLHIYVHF